MNIRIQLTNNLIPLLLIKQILITLFTVINSLIIHESIINRKPPNYKTQSTWHRISCRRNTVSSSVDSYKFRSGSFSLEQAHRGRGHADP
jgi:hypothetical protein